MTAKEVELNATINHQLAGHAPEKLMKQEAQKLVVDLQRVSRNDVLAVGGKGASLGELIRAGATVPPGFVITTSAFSEFITANNLAEKIRSMMTRLDSDDALEVQNISCVLKSLIMSAKVPDQLCRDIERAYILGDFDNVAVRSSATVEDSDDASFAGQQDTFLNVRGVESIVEAMKACWASLFGERSLFYRNARDVIDSEYLTAVVVQRMVNASRAGVMFTADPTSGDRSKMLIEAVIGLGEPLVSGEVSPDSYYVDSKSKKIVSSEIAAQYQALVMEPDPKNFEKGTRLEDLSEAVAVAPKLTDEQLRSLVSQGMDIQRYFGKPQDIEWAIDGDQLYIVQSRPITTLSESQPEPVEQAELAEKPLVTGSAASPGVVVGRPRVIRNPSEIMQLKPGEILVTEMTTPDFVPAMKRASAIVTERGGRSCHAAIVSREMGVPCIVGAQNATQVLAAESEVTVDATSGNVYAGDLSSLIKAPEHKQQSTEHLKTRTRVYTNVSDPDMAEMVAKHSTDGVGLLRAEFMISHLIGEHPAAMYDAGRGQEFTEKLHDGLEKFAAAFHPRPVVYRFSDFKTNEYRGLKGGEKYERIEENPMIGYRGCARYIAAPELFKLEVDAVAQVRKKWPNLWAMLPFVRTVDELAKTKQLLHLGGLRRDDGFKLWMMAEVPSNVLLLDEFLDLGIDGVSIGSNDLTQLVLGIDRDSEMMADLLDERDPAVMKALSKIVTTCKKRGISVSICGQAPSVYPELTSKLVSWGITSVSVTPDMLVQTRQIVHDAEVLVDRERAAVDSREIDHIAVSAD